MTTPLSRSFAYALMAVSIAIITRALAEPPPPGGTPPPEPLPPVGYEDWQETGELPKRLFLPSAVDNGHAGVVVSTPDQPHRRRDRKADWRFPNLDDPSFPGFRVGQSPDKPKRYWLTIGGSDRRPSNKSTYAEVGYAFDVASKDVIPIYDQIYATRWLGSGLQLTLVTDLVPEELRPRLDTRTISAVSMNAFLFHEQHAVYKGREDFDEVTIEFENGTGKALANFEPLVSYREQVPPEGRVPTLPARPRMKLEVAKDGLLTARGRSYKVLNVVPPQDIKDVGHLVGWIELAPDPIEPPPADAPQETKAK